MAGRVPSEPEALELLRGRCATAISKIATVATARKLVVIAWHLLSRGEDYAFVRRGYEGAVDRLVEGFQRQADLVRRLDGFARAFLLVDRAGGRAMTVTIWDSREALEGSASRAAHLREEAVETAAATIGSVDGYELAFDGERSGG